MFSCHLNKATGYNCTHPDFPGTTFQVAKNNFMLTEEGESPFGSEVVAPPPAKGTAATATETVAPAGPSANNDLNSQILWASTSNAMNSVHSRLIFSIAGHRTNVDTSDIGELHALGLKVDNKDLLPENLLNVGTMNCASDAVGTWINPSLCPCVQESCHSSYGKFSSINWDVISEIDKLELFWVCQYILNELFFQKKQLKLFFPALLPSFFS